MFVNRFIWLSLLFVVVSCQSSPRYTPPTVSLTPGAVAISAYLRGQMAAKVADYPAAAQAYLDAVSVNTTDTDLRRKAMDYSIAAGNIDTALRLARTIPAEAEPGSMAYLLQMVAAVRENDQEAAQQFMQRALQTAPDMMHFLILAAYLDAEDPTALAAHRKKLAAKNVSPILQARLKYHLGRLAWLANDEAQTRSAWQEAYELEPGALFTALHYGRLLESDGATAEARKVYQTFLERHGNTLLLHHVMQRLAAGQPPPPVMTNSLTTNMNETLFGLGMLLWAQDLHMAAQQALQVALYAQETPYVRFYLGLLNEHAGRHAVAAAHFQKVPLAGPAGLAAHMRLGETYRQQGQHTKARQLYVALLALHPDVPVIYDQLANLARNKQDFPTAIHYYTRLLEQLKPDDKDIRFQTLYARGAVYERMGNVTLAAQDMQAALKLRPDDADVLNYLGYMWLDAGKHIDKAFAMVKKALQQKPNDGAILDSVGWGYYQKGQYAQALLYIQRAQQILPDDPTIIEHLGDIQDKLGNPTKARQYWQQAWDMGPVGEREKKRLRHKLRFW